MTKTQKTHFIYALISICAVCAYGGFMIRNAIRDVGTTEETLPYDQEEEFVLSPPVTEPIAEEISTEAPTSPVTNEAWAIQEALKEATEPSSPPASEPKFSPILPVEGTIIKNHSDKHTYNEATNDWRSHMGIDIKANAADNVMACEDGAVISAYNDSFWGNVIEIDHGEYISVYKNVSTLIMVKEGDSVKKGDTISGVGENALAEGCSVPYIHFEMLCYGEYTDPLLLID